MIRNENTCVCCGRSIPEGTMVCSICKTKAGQLGKIRKKEKTYTVTQTYLDKMVKTAALEMLTKGIKDFRDQELPMIREDVRKILSLYQSIWRDVLGEMGLLTRDNAKEILTKTAERWDHVDELIMNGNIHELQQYANSLGADEDVFLGDLLERKDTPQHIAEIILEEDDDG